MTASRPRGLLGPLTALGPLGAGLLDGMVPPPGSFKNRAGRRCSHRPPSLHKLYCQLATPLPPCRVCGNAWRAPGRKEERDPSMGDRAGREKRTGSELSATATPPFLVQLAQLQSMLFSSLVKIKGLLGPLGAPCAGRGHPLDQQPLRGGQGASEQPPATGLGRTIVARLLSQRSS